MSLSITEIDCLVLTFAPTTQEIFKMFFRQHQSFDQIATRMDISKQEVKVVVAAILCEVMRVEKVKGDYAPVKSRRNLGPN